MRRLLGCATVVTNTLLCAAMGKGVAMKAMKRFTTEGTNDQEGRELIPAQRNAEEEEAPLGLSFEGVAGARWLSRRQAIGLLGGSLVGVSLLSSGLAAPAKSEIIGINHNDIITLKCLGDLPGPRYLDGRTQNGTVGLAPNTNPPFTGTRWDFESIKVVPASGNAYWYDVLRCQGREPGPRYLDGRTQDGSVGLAPEVGKGYTGTHWETHVVGKA
jgi:hypothetical protein